MATTSVDQVTGYGETVAYKAPCRLATTGNITLSGLQAIDGSVTASRDRVLVKDQADGRQNGIYIASTGLWQRARDMDSNRDLTKGTQVAVTDGSTSAGREYAVTTNNPISIGITALTFTETWPGLPSPVVGGTMLLSKLDGSGYDFVGPGAVRDYLGVGVKALRYSTEFGFVDDGTAGADTGTNNDAAWAAAKAALTHGESLVMVRKITGVFYFATQSDFTGVPIDATAKPTFTGPNVYNDRTTAQKDANAPAVTVVGTGELLFTSSSLNTTFHHHSEPVDKFDFLTDGDVAYEEPTVVAMTGAVMNRYSWPNGDTPIATSAGISKATNLINIDWSAADLTTLIMAQFAAEAGCQYSWVLGANPTDTVFAVLAFNGGYHALYAPVGGDFVHKKWVSSGTFSETSIPAFGNGTVADVEPAYTLAGASVTIDLVTPTRYQIGVNGVVIAEGALPQPALYVGPGFYKPAALAEVSNIQNVVKVRNPTRLAARPIRALFLGDSKTDDIFIGWPRDIARIMQGSMGTQWEASKNIAVAGDTLAGQLALLLAEALTGYTDIFWAPGTNDVGQSQATYKANLHTAFDYALSGGARLHILLTPQYYSRAAAAKWTGFANQGQNSASGAGVPLIREYIRVVTAEYRDAGKLISMTDAGKVCGVTLARYLTWSAQQNRVDVNVFDNIHESRLCRTKFAQGVARAAFGLMTPKRTSGAKTMLTLTSVGGTVAAGATAYLGTYAGASALVSAITVPYAGIVRNLRTLASAVPGASQSYTYTLMVNGAATILTCTTTAAVLLSADQFNQVAVAAGASLSVRVVNSATGAVATHQCSVEIDPT